MGKVQKERAARNVRRAVREIRGDWHEGEQTVNELAQEQIMTRPPSRLAGSRRFWAAWSGWTLDGMDRAFFALVWQPALTELLPKSGHGRLPGLSCLPGTS